MTPAKIDTNKQVEWGLLEYHPANPDKNLWIGQRNSNASWKHSSLERLATDRQIEVTTSEGVSNKEFHPTPTMFASNANGAHVELWTEGGNYIAIGMVIGVDLGDGPKSYGQAGAMGQQLIEGDMWSLISEKPQGHHINFTDRRVEKLVLKAYLPHTWAETGLIRKRYTLGKILGRHSKTMIGKIPHLSSLTMMKMRFLVR
ncbi:hypothetical protein [Arcanobacterium hippocoleae]|uniref:hypothetical protein n=1 Tax=Arcanobacterium hippocoleae TaxID=149017 RepID=UPI003342DC3F